MRCHRENQKAWQPLGLCKSLVTGLLIVFSFSSVGEAQYGGVMQVMPTEGDMYGTSPGIPQSAIDGSIGSSGVDNYDYNSEYEGLDSGAGTVNDLYDVPEASGYEQNRLIQSQQSDGPPASGDNFQLDQPDDEVYGRIDAGADTRTNDRTNDQTNDRTNDQTNDRTQASEDEAARKNNENNQAAKDKQQNETDQAKEDKRKAEEERRNQQADNDKDRETEEEKRKREEEQRKKNEQGQQAGGQQPGGGQAQQPQPDLIYEERHGSYESAIQQLVPECQQMVQQVDQRCGPANPTMQQANQMVASLGKMGMGNGGRENCERFNEAMQSSRNYMNEYVNTCGERKVLCQNACGQLMNALRHKASFCNRDGWECMTPAAPYIPQMAQAQQQCGRHADMLAKAQQDMQTVGTSGGVAQACNRKLLTADSKAGADGPGSGNTASADLDAALEEGRDGKSDKFDLYSDSLKPANNAYIPSVKSKANKTNYQKKGNGTGPQVGGSGMASAGYAGQPAPSAGYAGAGSNGRGGVILGYGGRPRGGSGSSFGQAGSGGSGGSQAYGRGTNRGSASTMTAAEAAKYKKGMKLGDYLPGGSRDPQALKLAAYQKSDGITGPTGPTIWTKVSNRYRIHQDSMLPP